MVIFMNCFMRPGSSFFLCICLPMNRIIGLWVSVTEYTAGFIFIVFLVGISWTANHDIVVSLLFRYCKKNAKPPISLA